MGNSLYQSTSGLLCADVSQLREEIVRCRDCEHYIDAQNECNLQDEWNEFHWLDVEPDGFCAWAVRRES